MKFAHIIKVSVFSHESEDPDQIFSAFLKLFPFELEEEKIKLQKGQATGFEQKQIHIFEVDLKKNKHINAFLKKLMKNLKPEQKSLILKQAESRLDDELNFYLRFDLKELLLNKKLELVDHGHCFHIKMSIAAFPAKKEQALNIVKELFS